MEWHSCESVIFDPTQFLSSSGFRYIRFSQRQQRWQWALAKAGRHGREAISHRLGSVYGLRLRAPLLGRWYWMNSGISQPQSFLKMDTPKHNLWYCKDLKKLTQSTIHGLKWKISKWLLCLNNVKDSWINEWMHLIWCHTKSSRVYSSQEKNRWRDYLYLLKHLLTRERKPHLSYQNYKGEWA